MNKRERDLFDILRSPDSAKPLQPAPGCLVTADGAESYPVVDGVPVLLGAQSVFAQSKYEPRVGRRAAWTARGRALVKRLLPSLSHNLVAKHNYLRLVELLLQGPGSELPPRVLVVGGAVAGEGFDAVIEDPRLELIETDVARGPRTSIVCDAHALPFADDSFDGAVCQAVLEHVADPSQVVAELHRVLRRGGLVYSEVPFMQQVHEGAHDFTRFTLTGHRRLFRHFVELHSGATSGPGMALGWAIRSFFITFAGDRMGARVAINLAVTLTVFWAKQFDHLLLRHPAAIDGASGTYFLGRSSETPASDRDIIASYRGADSGFGLVR